MAAQAAGFAPIGWRAGAAPPGGRAVCLGWRVAGGAGSGAAVAAAAATAARRRAPGTARGAPATAPPPLHLSRGERVRDGRLGRAGARCAGLS